MSEAKANTRRHAVGDRVRYMFYSFEEMAKSEYLLPHLFADPDPAAPDIMLGGAYEVLDVRTNQWGVRMYRLLTAATPPSWAPEALVFAAGDVPLCPYGEGAALFFAPVSDPRDVEVMSLSHPDYGLTPGAGPFYLTRIINGYYINVRKPGVPAATTPFRWEDFAEG